MELAERFRAAISAAYDEQTACSELVPNVLSRACVTVLPVAGAGLSITDKLRVPLGASDADSALVERLQTTLGEGPCLAATEMRRPMMADLATIATRWPLFHRQLVTHTPFRAVLALPLFSRDRTRFGALELYFTMPEAVPDFFVEDVNKNIADPIAAVLFDGRASSSAGSAPPAWLDNDAVRDRMNVWVAVGILIEYTHLSNADALSVLRGYAFSHDATLDDVAQLLLSRQLAPASVVS